MSTIIVWFRNDLRVHDHPALAKAVAEADKVIPVFIYDDTLLKGKHASSNRNRFLLECLADLKASLVERGANLVVRSGNAVTELRKLAEEHEAKAVFYSADYGPYALKRDKKVEDELKKNDIEVRGFAGRLAVGNLQKLRTKNDQIYKVFTPFWRNWSEVQRREVAATPRSIPFPNVTIGSMPALSDITTKSELSSDVLKGGETEARKRLHAFIKKGMSDYADMHNTVAQDGTSRLSPYLHFGCLSPREIETMLPDTKGARSWHRQLAWREFYHYILLHFPQNSNTEFQERYRNMKWGDDATLLNAWKQGKTGYPIVDAAMRQLAQEGWMHNRARLIVGSFLTKDLWLDWRLGETHFMRMLLDGDEANNNGNWQWIASVGVDPAPVFRRLYNPTSQAKNYDPDGEYIRRYVTELKDVPEKYLNEPWTMSDELQRSAHCIIGKDYPEPIVDHKQARLQALENYRASA